MRWCVGAEGRVVRDDDAVAVWACRIEGRSDLVIEDDISVLYRSCRECVYSVDSG